MRKWYYNDNTNRGILESQHEFNVALGGRKKKERELCAIERGVMRERFCYKSGTQSRTQMATKIILILGREEGNVESGDPNRGPRHIDNKNPTPSWNQMTRSVGAIKMTEEERWRQPLHQIGFLSVEKERTKRYKLKQLSGRTKEKTTRALLCLEDINEEPLTSGKGREEKIRSSISIKKIDRNHHCLRGNRRFPETAARANLEISMDEEIEKRTEEQRARKV